MNDDRVRALAEQIRQTLRVPRNTYRVQLSASFTFDDLRARVPYLDALGVDTCYLSPCLAAKPGSTHGYDVVDHSRVNPELGTEESFRALAAALEARGIGLMFDVVPNHMNLDPVHNRHWRDLLENGQSAASASWFDVDWQPVKLELHDKVLLPILGDQYGLVLERGELRVALRDGAFVVRYFDNELPIDPSQIPFAIGPEVEAHRAQASLDPARDSPEHSRRAAADDGDTRELLSVLTAFGNLPKHVERDPARREERQRERQVAYERFAALIGRAPAIRALIERAIERLNGEVRLKADPTLAEPAPADPSRFDALHQLLEQQPYRLAYWRTALDEINYRRFFDIIELGAMRVEDPLVFAEAHAFVLQLARDGIVTAIRLDHPDGLNDPEAYFEQLQAAVWRVRAEALGADAEMQAALDAWRTARRAEDLMHWAVRPMYVAAEKILVPGERFRAEWSIHGGVGYLFLNQVNGLFVDRAGMHQLERLWSRMNGPADFAEIAYETRALIARTSLASEMNMLAHALERIAARDRRSRDFTLNSVRKVLREVVACFPVYRTYVTERGVPERDREVIARAVSEARRRSPVMEASIFDFIEEVLSTEGQGDSTERQDFSPGQAGTEGHPSAAAAPGTPPVPALRTNTSSNADERVRFAMRFQQITGPIQAKGLEDTAFYRYCPLLAANEVGSDPANPSVGIDQFHDLNRARLSDWPTAMLALATHDTKRSGDARARLASLTERPADWRRAIANWMRLNARHRATIASDVTPSGAEAKKNKGGAEARNTAPSKSDEYHFYQALLAIWPPEPDDAAIPTVVSDEIQSRVSAYMVKAIREAKLQSSWLRPNQAYEDATAAFIHAVLTGPGSTRFLARFVPFARSMARLGASASLAQLVLQMGAPGIPDVYQGTELWHLRLVDPDNRLPVDFTQRTKMLDALLLDIERVERGLSAGAAAQADADLTPLVRDLAAQWHDGRLKLWVLALLLRYRRRELAFRDASYTSLVPEPSNAPLVAFARVSSAGRAVIVAAARHAARPHRDWPTGAAWTEMTLSIPLELERRQWRDLLTGRTMTVRHDEHGREHLVLSDVFDVLPVAWLETGPA